MVISAARNVFLEYADGRLPVDVFQVAERLGYEVRPISGGTVSGSAYIDLMTGKKVIEYRTSDSHYRRRFTIAHEIGHHVLGHTAGGKHLRDDDYQAGSSPIEIDANAFAAELLAPQEWVELLVEKVKANSISEMAKFFDVSGAVIEYRLKDLGYLPSYGRF